MMSLIHLSYIYRPPFGDESRRAASDEFNQHVNEGTPVSEAYRLLSPEQRLDLRQTVENPAVRVRLNDGSYMFEEANLHLLERLERVEHVGPVSETQVSRPAGTKAF